MLHVFSRLSVELAHHREATNGLLNIGVGCSVRVVFDRLLPERRRQPTSLVIPRASTLRATFQEVCVA